LFLILANGFFVAAEFAWWTVERPRRNAPPQPAPPARASWRPCTNSPSSSPAPSSASPSPRCRRHARRPALADLLTGPLTSAGLPDGAAPGVAVVLGMMVASAVQMVIGELVPKNWAVSRPLAVARMVAGPQRAFSQVFRPVIEVLNTAANRLVRMLGVEPADEMASARTPTELVSLARHSALAGALEQDTADLFVRTLSLGDLIAENVMTPRVRVSALEDTATAADVLNLTRATACPASPSTGAAGRHHRHGAPQGRPRRPRGAA